MKGFCHVKRATQRIDVIFKHGEVRVVGTVVIATQALTWSSGLLLDTSVGNRTTSALCRGRGLDGSNIMLLGLFSLTFFGQRASIILLGRCRRSVRRVFKFIQPAVIRGSLGCSWLRLSFCPEITGDTQNTKAYNDSQDAFHTEAHVLTVRNPNVQGGADICPPSEMSSEAA